MPEEIGYVKKIDMSRSRVKIGQFEYRVTSQMLTQFIDHYPPGTLVKVDIEMGWIKSVVKRTSYVE